MSSIADRDSARRFVELVGSADLPQSGDRLRRETFPRLDLLAGRDAS